MNATDFHSRYFTLRELTHSTYAIANSIPNLPDDDCLENLQTLCDEVLDPLRELYGLPISVNSGYRSPAVNSGVGGARNSQHLLGEAADITTGDRDMNRRLLGLLMASRLPFDQCIAEHCDELGRPRWLHVSCGPRERRQVIYDYEKKSDTRKQQKS